ncbi:MAG TPA: LysR family transcriptional regulator [Burkholderiaceae bacterium]|nr:LysR family transcriptional regulator [Burkholderiaceae bacterium]
MSNIRFFRTFLEVARHGSFVAASEQVSLTPTAVGLQIQALEEFLGYTVVDRAGKGIHLNQRGHRLVPLAEQLLDLCDQMRLDEPDQTSLSGTLKVASIATSMGYVVRAVLKMRAKYPNVSVQPGISYSGDLPTRVKEGELDAALSVKTAHRTPAGVIWTPLYTEPLVFITSARTKETDIEALLARKLFLRVSLSSATGVLIDRFMKRHKLKSQDFLEMNAMRTIVDLVRDDLGVTILPLFTGADWAEDENLRIIPIDGDQAVRHIGLYENESRSFLTSVLRQALIKEVKSRGI